MSKKSGFTQPSNAVIRCPILHPLAKTVYNVMLSYAQLRPDRKCRISHKKIAYCANVGESTVKKLIVILEECGLVEKVVTGKGKCTIYKVNFESEFFNNSPEQQSKLPENLEPSSQVATNNNQNNNTNNESVYDEFFKEREEWNYLNLRS